MNRLTVCISGVVQGVGYRYFVVRRARECNVTGWVKNRSDGSVQIEAVGQRGALEDFLSGIRIGPPAAHISGVDAQWAENGPEYETFDVKF